MKPGKHNYGIARYLLTESVKYVKQQRPPLVLDPLGLVFVPASLRAKLGFREAPTEGGLSSALGRTE